MDVLISMGSLPSYLIGLVGFVYPMTSFIEMAATINKEGMLQVRATRVGADTFLSQVVRLVEQAQGSRVPIQEFADKVTAKFVPAVILISLASLAAWLLFAESLRPSLYWGSEFLPWVNPELSPLMAGILSAVAVLVIACPCALGLATPTAIMVGSGLGAESGVLIRSGEAIQTLKDIKAIVLDKTGTITKGEPALTDVIAAADFNESEVLRFAASVEAG